MEITQPKNRGLVLNPIVENKDGVFGSSLSFVAKGAPIQLDGNWTPYLPKPERQSREEADGSTFDTMSCATFGTDNQVEMYVRKVFGRDIDYSDRFLSKSSGTTPQGNDPHLVLESLRKQGTVEETLWPWSSEITTWAQYFADIPRNIYAVATSWMAEFDLWHDYVPTDPATIRQALKYSPVAVSVLSLIDPDTGLYYKPDGYGLRDTHWAVIFNMDEQGNYDVFDTYEPFVKKFKAGYKFERAKVITITRQIVNEYWWMVFLKWVFGTYAPKAPVPVVEIPPTPTPTPAPTPTAPTNNILNTFCLAIQKHEGWILNPPSRSVRNNNPGNCKFSSVGYDPKYGVVKKDSGGFAIFRDYETGFLYLKNLIIQKVKKNPTWDFYRFFGDPVQGYAPAADNNDPKRYAEVVAKACGVSPTTATKILIS